MIGIQVFLASLPVLVLGTMIALIVHGITTSEYFEGNHWAYHIRTYWKHGLACAFSASAALGLLTWFFSVWIPFVGSLGGAA